MATPVKWGNEFLVNTNTANDQDSPAITGLADGRFVVMWEDDSHTLNDTSDAVHGQIFNADGSKAGAEFRVNSTKDGEQILPKVAALPDGGFVAAWVSASAGQSDVYAQVFKPDGSKSGVEILANTTLSDSQTAQDITPLASGGFVVTWADLSGNDFDIRAQMFDASGGRLGNEFLVNTLTASHQRASATEGLTNGRFVVAWESDSGASDTVRLQMYDADGDTFGGEFPVTQFATGDQGEPTITALANGRFIVSWILHTGNDFDVHGQIFDADGKRSGAEFSIESNAVGNLYPDITALPDGRFVVTSVAEFGVVNLDIVAQLFNADGTRSGSEFTVNTSIDGYQTTPKIAALADGRFAVAWTDVPNPGGGDGSGSGIRAQIFDPRESGADIRGNQLNDDLVGTGFGDTMKGGGGADRLAGMGGDDVLEGGAGADTLSGGDGIDTASYVHAATWVNASLRSGQGFYGDALGDSLSGIENLTGSDHSDLLTGDAGANVIEGGLGSDGIYGEDGDDTAVFSHNFNDYTVTDFGGKMRVEGPDGNDILASIEHLKFADTTIDVTDDGNALFDTLYYLSRNGDVFHAGANALDHFNTFGRHEGRDPNAFFDTSEYLSVYRDAAASGMNPLDHYHQIGWKQGHDPSERFDTRLYLVHNPDVAAAGVDPLAHFLAFGWTEGRQAYSAVGENIVGGFDAEYYLRHNPDVAAAGVDPLAHFNTSGWHEGRSPNAWFNTAGYLAHYADVAAAGVNPLDHYEQFGWKEGRDPSAGFDTLGYLANNPDVAAAHVNPLDHFLTFGIYEGRHAVNDGVWH